MTFDQVLWTEMKAFVDARSLSIQWREDSTFYYLRTSDGWFGLQCFLHKTNDASSVTDFEDNYLGVGNKPIIGNIKTQFERTDLTIKIAKLSGAVNGTGDVTCDILIPGTFNGVDPEASNGRVVSGGTAFFNDWHAGDAIDSIQVKDIDNILGYGAGTVIKTYCDDDVGGSGCGWFIPPNKRLELETLGFYGFIPAGLYLRVVAKKGSGQTTGTFYTNITWGKHE